MGIELSELIFGDCIEEMAKMPDDSVDMVFCDLPYNTTKAKWDNAVDLDELWVELKRIVKPNRAVCLTAVQPFTSKLVMSNPKWFRHEWIWDKKTARGHLVAKKRPMQQHESVVIFGNGGVLYNPQMVELEIPEVGNRIEASRTELVGGETTGVQGKVTRTHKYPKTIQYFKMDKNIGHSTQKPVALCEYMINTYSNEGDVVLDMTAGSGTTAIAAINTNREYICIENDQTYFDLMTNRVAGHKK